MAERMTTPPTPPELVALLELSEMATPGIWEMYGGTNHARVQTADVIVCDGSPPHFMGKEDAKFIAALVNWFRHTAPTLPGAGGKDAELRAIAQEMRDRKVGRAKLRSPTLCKWADRIDAALPPQQGG